MKNIFILVFITTGMVLNSVAVYAADEVKNSCDVAVGCLVKSTTTPARPAGSVGDTPISGTTTTTSTTTGSLGTAGTGAYSQAAAAKSQANSTMMIAIVMAAMFASQCGPHNPTACMLAAAAAAAAMMAAGKKNEAQNLMNNLGTDGTPTTTTDTTQTTDGSNPAGDLAKIRADLVAKGYTVNADGSVTAPNGSTVDPSLSDGSLSKAGLTPAEASGVQAGLDKMRKDIKDKLAESGNGSGGADGSGGASGGMSGSYGATGETGKGTPSAGAERMGLDRNPASWDGFYKKYGDSLIGVGGNDIFLMVEKRVESERKGMGY